MPAPQVGVYSGNDIILTQMKSLFKHQKMDNE